MSNQIQQLGAWGQILATAANIGSQYLGSKGGTNYAKSFSSQVGTGKMYLQSEADAYRATAAQYGLDAVQLAKAESDLGRPLSQQELNILAGRQNAGVSVPAGVTPTAPVPASSPYGQELQQKAQEQQAAAKKANWLPWAAGGWLLYKFLL